MSTSKSKRRGSRVTAGAYHHGDLRNALINATLELIPGTGVRELSLREVSRRAGVSHAASYRHFSSKESLLAAVAAQGFTLLAEALHRSVESSQQSAIARLQAAGIAYVDFGLRHPEHLNVMFGGAITDFHDYPELNAAARRAQEELRAVVSAVVRDGILQAADEQTVEAAAWSIVHGLTVLLADEQIQAPGGKRLARQAQIRLATAVTGLFCDGLVRPAGGDEQIVSAKV